MLGPKVLSNGTASAAAARAIVMTFATSIAAARRHSQQRQLEQLQQLEQQQQQSRSRILKNWSREYFEDRHANNAGQSDSYKPWRTVREHCPCRRLRADKVSGIQKYSANPKRRHTFSVVYNEHLRGMSLRASTEPDLQTRAEKRDRVGRYGGGA